MLLQKSFQLIVPQTQKLLIRYDGVGANVILLGQIIDTRHMGGVLNILR